MSNFIVADRKTDYLLPPSVDDWLNQDHLARFIVEVVDQLDLSKLTRQYAGRGSKAHHPATLLAILIYGYATGIFSSRRLERATYDSVAFRYIAAGTHPDHDTLAAFRRRFLDELSGLFVQVLEIAEEMKLLKLGNVCLDGTKIKANASRHSALSHGHIEKLELQLKAEVQELLAQAEQADQADVPDGVSLPEEIKRREDRLAAMAAAKAKIAARAEERYQREKAEYDEKMARRAAQEAATDKKLGGTPPKAPAPGPLDKDQINLTDEESRIMPVAGGGFEQAYNAQAAVDAPTMLVVATGVTQAPNDKEQVEPMLATLKAQAEVLGPVQALLTDTGYFSDKNLKACDAAGIDALIAVARDEHHPDWRERHSEPPPLPAGATRAQAMSHRLKTKAGRALYALRKQTVEPVFGIIKSVLGFRQFSLRGLKKVTGEWTLVCMAWNLKRMAVLRP
ncbi:MAG: IS1182 family transposase [Accumulibacter sp.]|uniref:IS1182 family transposase n=1 Tax=Accumulibacter sp. TaxID=2053492 RepID=UPI00331490E9